MSARYNNIAMTLFSQSTDSVKMCIKLTGQLSHVCLVHAFITDSTRQHTLVSLTLTSFSDSMIIID